MNKSIVFANGCGSPHSLKMKRSSLFESTQQVFGIKSYRRTLEKKLEQIGGMQKIDIFEQRNSRRNVLSKNEEANKNRTAWTNSKKFF